MWGLRSAPTYRFTKVELAGNEQQGDELEGTWRLGMIAKWSAVGRLGETGSFRKDKRSQKC